MEPLIDLHQITIRPVKPDDLAAVLEVYRQCEDFLALGPQPHASVEMVNADLEHSRLEGGIFCGVFAGSPPGMVGIIDYLRCGFEGAADTAFLSLLMIGAPYRHLGLGALIVKQVEDEIWQDPQITAICSGVQVNNPLAIRFWQSRGYAISGPPQTFADQTTAFPLRKTRPAGERHA